MKKFILITACLGLISTAAFCQAASSKTKTQATAAKYVCPKCQAVSNKPGTCAHCKMKLVKEGDYYCPGCGASSSKPGKCAKCNKDMVKMVAKA